MFDLLGFGDVLLLLVLVVVDAELAPLDDEPEEEPLDELEDGMVVTF